MNLDGEQASEAATALAHLFQRTLDFRKSQVVTLTDRVAALEQELERHDNDEGAVKKEDAANKKKLSVLTKKVAASGEEVALLQTACREKSLVISEFQAAHTLFVKYMEGLPNTASKALLLAKFEECKFPKIAEDELAFDLEI
jgi:hypothetical protein